jgi:hypothetical protein
VGTRRIGWHESSDRSLSSFPAAHAGGPKNAPIHEGEGYVLVRHRKTRGDPNEARSDDDLPKIAFAAYHKTCDPDPETDAYWIAVERAATLTAWVWWTHHFTEKAWVSRDDLGRMMSFWFANRGVNLEEMRQ